MTHADLTRREREVFELAGAHLREEEIADCLGIARSTVAMLLRSGMQKLGVRTRGEAVARLNAIGDGSAPDARPIPHPQRRPLESG
jgi:DNA-binding CsgD family transcriptional regulator